MIHRERELTFQPNGCVSLVLPEDVALLPPEWEGKYPKRSRTNLLMKLSESQNHRCAYCGMKTWSFNYTDDPDFDRRMNRRKRNRRMATVEHIVTRQKGGTDRKCNIVMACMGCNTGRNQSNPVIFMYERAGRLNFELVSCDD